MEAFWAITLSAILILRALRSKKPPRDELNRNTVKARWDRKRIKAEKLKQEARLAQKAARAAEKQRQKDAELITVILPTINDSK